MGCTGSNTNEEKKQEKKQQVKKDDKEIFDEKSNYLYCYSDGEKDLIQNLLKSKKFEKDEIIYNKVSIKADNNSSSFIEYLTIQTEKVKGQKYSGKYTFISSAVSSKEVLKIYVKINNNSIETLKNISGSNFQTVEIEYNLSENDCSIITLEINSIINTELESNLLSINFNYSGGYFCLNIKASEDLIYSNMNRETVNNFQKMSENEIIITGNKEENDLRILFKYKERKYKLSKNMKYFYYCDEEEIKDMETALNSIEIEEYRANIFAIKDIYNIKNDKCTAKTYMTFIYPNEEKRIVCANFFFKIKPNNNLKYINCKQNNETEISAELQAWNAFNIYFVLEKELFCTIELEYSFSLTNTRENTLKLDVNHNEMLLTKGYYSFLVHYEIDDIKEILKLSEMEKDKNDPIYQYKGKSFKKKFAMVLIWFILNKNK